MNRITDWSLCYPMYCCVRLTAFAQQQHNWVKTQAGVFSRFLGMCIAVDQQDHKARFKLSNYLALTKLASHELLVVILSFNSAHQCQCQCSVPDMNFYSCQLSLAIKESRHFSTFLNKKNDSFGKYFHFCQKPQVQICLFELISNIQCRYQKGQTNVGQFYQIKGIKLQILFEQKCYCECLKRRCRSVKFY